VEEPFSPRQYEYIFDAIVTIHVLLFVNVSCAKPTKARQVREWSDIPGSPPSRPAAAPALRFHRRAARPPAPTPPSERAHWRTESGGRGGIGVRTPAPPRATTCRRTRGRPRVRRSCAETQGAVSTTYIGDNEVNLRNVIIPVVLFSLASSSIFHEFKIVQKWFKISTAGEYKWTLSGYEFVLSFTTLGCVRFIKRAKQSER